MKTFPNKKRRRSIRLKSYDYSKPGSYFVTICTQGFSYLFRDVVDGVMKLNERGRIIEKWWFKLPEKFPAIEIDEHITMPNHFHGIIQIPYPVWTIHESSKQTVSATAPVGADPCVCPPPPHEGGHMGPPLQKMVQWFKTMTTNEYIDGIKHGNFPKFSKRLWQRNYYEHIIRDEDELNRIREYIQNNFAKWADDKYFVN